MFFLYDITGGEVGDGPGNFDDFEIGTSGEIELFGGGLKEVLCSLAELEKSGDLMRGKGRIKSVMIAVARILASRYLCYGIFYNIMFVGGI